MKKPEPTPFPIDRAAAVLKRVVPTWKVPIVTKMAAGKPDPFKILISTILSLRTKDECTAEASRRLYKLARTPRTLLKIDEATISQTIYPVGFYRTKAKTIHGVCRDLIDRFGGKTPDDIDELLSLKGVGRKTANLVRTKGFGKPGICVDTHVHRITNRWGYVKTKTPDETEMVLREILPKRYWIPNNDWLVTYGQSLCMPVSPWCSRCEIRPFCPRIGVKKSR